MEQPVRPGWLLLREGTAVKVAVTGVSHEARGNVRRRGDRDTEPNAALPEHAGDCEHVMITSSVGPGSAGRDSPSTVGLPSATVTATREPDVTSLGEPALRPTSSGYGAEGEGVLDGVAPRESEAVGVEDTLGAGVAETDAVRVREGDTVALAVEVLEGAG